MNGLDAQVMFTLKSLAAKVSANDVLKVFAERVGPEVLAKTMQTIERDAVKVITPAIMDRKAGEPEVRAAMMLLGCGTIAGKLAKIAYDQAMKKKEEATRR